MFDIDADAKKVEIVDRFPVTSGGVAAMRIKRSVSRCIAIGFFVLSSSCLNYIRAEEVAYRIDVHAHVGVPYNFPLDFISGGSPPFKWSLKSGQLPLGLS